MKFSAATLCNYAQEQSGTLTVVSAGITRLLRSDYPAPLGIMVAMLLEAPEHVVRTPQELRAFVEREDGERLVGLMAAFQLTEVQGADPGELLIIPSVIDLRHIPLPAPGRYQIALQIMGHEGQEQVLSFRALLAADS
ncbi:MAG: hypothetical protein OXG69_15210 [bacterium]|nr:hypothetical protein [bacterium]